MANLFNGKVVEISATQVKRCEKVFIANNCPYFTNGSIQWDDIRVRYTMPLTTNGKIMVNASKIIKHIQENNLKQAIQDEFLGVDLLDWMEKNMVERNNVKNW